ncbi:MAG: ATP-binding protein [Desulfuromonadales bacterium]
MQLNSTFTANPDDINTLIVRKQSELVYSSTYTSQIASIIIGTLFAGIIYKWTNRSDIWIWLAFQVTTSTGRIMLYRAYSQHAPDGPHNNIWLRYHFIAVMISGIVWASGSVLFFKQDDPVVCFFIAMVIAGVVSGALPSLAPHFPAFCIFAVLNLFFLIVRTLFADRTEYYVLSALLILFAGVLLSSARFFNRILTDSLRLNIEKESLVEHLKQESTIAENANRAKSDFLAAMSHEIRTPLNGVLGMVGVLEDTPLSSQQQEYLKRIHISADTLLTLINDILDFSSIEAEKVTIQMLPFNPCDVCREVAELFGFTIKSKGLEFLWHVDQNLGVRFNGDANRIRQILINLVGNAVKFTDRGTITLELTAHDENKDGVMVLFSVQDTGTGIPTDKIPLLFNKFSQVSESLKHRAQGTGLGLAISKGLVAIMGGEIGVESEPGKGSVFWFKIRLPRTASLETITDVSYPAATETPVGRDDFKGLRILVVDDVELNRMLLVINLEKVGCRVDVAGNGVEAVGMNLTSDYDIIFMDCVMPDMDGYEATAKIRECEVSTDRHVPIIALTANAIVGEREKCFEAGMDDFLTKPFKMQEVLGSIRRWSSLKA